MDSTHETSVFVRERLDDLRDGRPEALEPLLVRVQDRFLVLTETMLQQFPVLRRWIEPEDVLQEATIRLVEALRSARCASPLHFYRLTALKLRQQLIDLARKYQGPEGLAANHDSIDPEAAPRATGPASEQDPAELARWTEFHTLVGELPEPQRVLFDLLWYQGLTHAEASTVLGVSEKTVQRQWQKARYELGVRLGR